jgi:uncharacterized protein (TIGR02996 family)
MTQEALLRAILLYPDEDTPRLEYADLLMEYGHQERGEWIDRAIRYPHNAFCELTEFGQRTGNPFPLLGIDLVAGLPGQDIWYWAESDEFGLYVFDSCRQLRYQVSRGFINTVLVYEECGKFFERHAAYLFARHPIQNVLFANNHYLRDFVGDTGMFHWRSDAIFHPSDSLPRALCPDDAYASIPEAVDGLSRHCVNYGRRLVGLPLLEPEKAVRNE